MMNFEIKLNLTLIYQHRQHKHVENKEHEYWQKYDSIRATYI